MDSGLAPRGAPRNDDVERSCKNKIIFCASRNGTASFRPYLFPQQQPSRNGAMPQRQLKLGAFMRPVSIHTGAWRYPGAWPDANFNFSHIKQLIRKLEAGKFDAFFMADHLAVLNMPINALKRSHTVTSFEPFTL